MTKNMVLLAVTGKKHSDGRSYLLRPNGTIDSRRRLDKRVSRNVTVSSHVLKNGEAVLSLISLPHSKSSQQKTCSVHAVKSFIARYHLKVLAESKIRYAPHAQPLGSSSVICSMDFKIRYPLASTESSLQAAPCDFRLLIWHYVVSGSSTPLISLFEIASWVDFGRAWHYPDCFMLPTSAVTKPAMLLSPLRQMPGGSKRMGNQRCCSEVSSKI
jgi:hypothetical protein